MSQLLMILVGIFCAESLFASDTNEWRPLFNGKDLTGWETYLGKPYKTWEVPGLKRDTNGVYLEPVAAIAGVSNSGGGFRRFIRGGDPSDSAGDGGNDGDE